MRQLVFSGPRSVEWAEVPSPTLGRPTAAILEPLVVSTCDMDAVALSGHIKFRAGTPLGHKGVGRVIEIGDDVTGHNVGDMVIVPWQTSSGRCDRCQRGQDAFCTEVPAGSCYGWGPNVERWGGFLADRILVPHADHMLVPLPDDLDARRACGSATTLSTPGGPSALRSPRPEVVES